MSVQRFDVWLVVCVMPLAVLLHLYHDNALWRVFIGAGFGTLGFIFGEWKHHTLFCEGKAPPGEQHFLAERKARRRQETPSELTDIGPGRVTAKDEAEYRKLRERLKRELDEMATDEAAP